ncbi:beta-N-acetylhexosaminidase [bacterium]|nr:beta-N-acetylhexosaminidase [bacterium]
MANIEEIEKKVGQLFFVGIPGTGFDSEAMHTCIRVGVGGIILFKHNYESVEQLVNLTSAIQKNMIPSSYKGLPAWIGVDQEGGRVQRFKDPFTILPPQDVWTKVGSPKACFEAGFVLGKELRACGISVNFAPVIDVLQGESRAIGDRSFSADPEEVATLGSAVVRGIQKSGVLSVAKHFPGHGGVQADSHEELPVSKKTLKELESIDWPPFKKSIRSRVEGIMTAHILFPEVDASRPATFSRIFLQDQLRKNLRYQKLIFSDDLEMGAVASRYDLKEAAFLAVEAGCDQLLFGHKWDQIEDVWQHLVKAFVDGVLPMERLDESIARISESKMAHLSPYRAPSIEEAKAFVGHAAHKELAAAIGRGEVPKIVSEA